MQFLTLVKGLLLTDFYNLHSMFGAVLLPPSTKIAVAIEQFLSISFMKLMCFHAMELFFFICCHYQNSKLKFLRAK